MTMNENLVEWFNESMNLIDLVNAEIEKGDEENNVGLNALKNKSMQNVILIKLLDDLYKKFPAVAFEVELFFERMGVDD